MKHNTKIIIIIIFVLFLTSVVWSADTGIVTNVTGRVEYKMLTDGNTWKPVVKGLQLTKDMVLKINQGSVCIVRVDTNVIQFDKASLYPLRNIFAQPDKADTLIGNMGRLTSIQDNHNNVSSVAGVRAADATDQKEELLLLDDDFGNSDPLEDASYFLGLDVPNLDGAIASLSPERLASLSTTDKASGFYLLGWSYFQLGQMQEAINAFNSALQIQGIDKDVKGKSLLFQSMALYEIGQYSDSLELSETILSNNQLKHYWKDALNISASNYLLLGDNSKANAYFQRIEKEFPVHE